MFSNILIANRGEIAVRIIRACRDLSISPTVVYSEADREALHVKLADEAYCIGSPVAQESYLAIERIVDAAKQSGADAVHPGYGFLSENPEFALACLDAQLVFIGPSPQSLALMGNKIASRKAVQKAGVPIIPGTDASLNSLEDALRLAPQIGYPVMLKASGGGGGKGLRVVTSAAELRSAYETTQNEAASSFKDSTLFLEKYLKRPRHVEVQVLGDLEGNIIHLGERECSIQRRHQKLLEESPSPLIDPDLRNKLGKAAITVAATTNYFNAGTVEFLVDDRTSEESRFYFLEMNTRLQVEHPVTEMVTGIDLVVEQIRIAAGQPLRYMQEDIQPRGASIECRIYAEDPKNNFFPSPGQISSYIEPSGPGIRCDSGVSTGSSIPIEYDPLISKVVVHAETRCQAVARMRRALREYKIGGVRTTIPFFEVLLSHPSFIDGELHTNFIEEHDLIRKLENCQAEDEVVPLVAAALDYFCKVRQPTKKQHAPRSVWKRSGRFPNLKRGW